MKRAFLCFAVVAMLAGMAYAGGGITNMDPNTVGCWLFDAEVTAGARSPGDPVAQYPPAGNIGEIVDSANGDNNATAVGRVWDGVGDQGDPASYVNTFAPYQAPSTGYANEPCSMYFGWYGGNETGSGVPPLAIQSRVECPSREGMGDWDLMVGDGVDYTIEAVIKPIPRAGVPDEAGWTGSTSHDFYGGIVCDNKLVRPSEGVALKPSWRFREYGVDNPVNGLSGLNFNLDDATINLNVNATNCLPLDGNWHHVAAVITSDEVGGVGTTTCSIYVDNVLAATGSKANLGNVRPSVNPDYPPPYDQPYVDAMWIGDMQGRWNDQFIGWIDGVAFSKVALAPGLDPVAGNFVLNRVPEPSSIVLLVMGALALLAIRRVR